MNSSFSLVKHAAFFDELEKIAAMASPQKKKGKLGKKLLAVGVQALGVGLGYATAAALHNAAMKRPTRLWTEMSPEKKYQILGGLKTLSALTGAHAMSKILHHREKLENE